MWVSPFRDLRINGYLLLPEAYRSLSRLSSALSAKASALRSYSLDLLLLHQRMQDNGSIVDISLLISSVLVKQKFVQKIDSRLSVKLNLFYSSGIRYFNFCQCVVFKVQSITNQSAFSILQDNAV